jgi:hypothetical protein
MEIIRASERNIELETENWSHRQTRKLVTIFPKNKQKKMKREKKNTQRDEKQV